MILAWDYVVNRKRVFFFNKHFYGNFPKSVLYEGYGLQYGRVGFGGCKNRGGPKNINLMLF